MKFDINLLVGWIFGATAVIGVAWAPVSCTNSNNEKIESAIKSGIDPIIAGCTYSGSADRAICATALLTKKGNGK